MDAHQGMAAPRRGRLGFEDSLNFTNSLCLAYVLCSAVLRGWIRRGIYGFDDVLIAIGTLVTTCHFVANYIALEHGAGKPWDYMEHAGNVTAYNQASVASVITFTLSLYLSKACVIAFLLRLTKKHGKTGLYKICLGCLAILGIACTLLVTVGWPQTLSAYWVSPSNDTACSIQSTRWLIWTILDLLTEIVLLLLPLQMVWSLQMPRKNKLIVLAVFYLRLPTIAISVGRLLYTQRLCAVRGDLGLDSALVLIWFAVEASYSLLASQFLALRTFTLGFNSGFGFGFTRNAGPESYSLQKTGKSGSNADTRKGGQDKTDIAFDQIWHTLPPNGNVDASSKGRTSLKITRDTEISVQYQDITDESPILRKQ